MFTGTHQELKKEKKVKGKEKKAVRTCAEVLLDGHGEGLDVKARVVAVHPVRCQMGAKTVRWMGAVRVRAMNFYCPAD